MKNHVFLQFFGDKSSFNKHFGNNLEENIPGSLKPKVPKNICSECVFCVSLSGFGSLLAEKDNSSI